MAEDWIKCHRSLMGGKWSSVPRATRFVLLELAMLCKPGDGKCELPPARYGSRNPIQRAADMFTGNRREVTQALRELSAGPSPSVLFLDAGGVVLRSCSDAGGVVVLSIPAFGRHQSTTPGAERMRRHRAKEKEKQGPSPNSDTQRVTHGDITDRHLEERRGEEIREEGERAREDAPATPPPKLARKKPVGPMPDGWSPTVREVALADGFGLDVSAEADAFRDWTAAKGVQYADWHRAFANHLRSEAKRSGPKPAHRPEPRNRVERAEQALADEERIAQRTNQWAGYHAAQRNLAAEREAAAERAKAEPLPSIGDMLRDHIEGKDGEETADH